MPNAALPEVAGPALAGQHGGGRVASGVSRVTGALQCGGKRHLFGEGGVQCIDGWSQCVVHRLVAGLGLAACNDTVEAGTQRGGELSG